MKDHIGNMKRNKVIKGINLLEIDELENKTRISDDIHLFEGLKTVQLSPRAIKS